MTFIGSQTTDQQLINHLYETGHETYWIPRNTFYLAPFPSYGWLYAKFSLEIEITLTPSLGWSPANIATSDILLKVRFVELHFTHRMYPCIFIHFYVIPPQSYWIRQNNANYTAITPFKVTNCGTNGKPICNFLLVINSNLSPILRRFQVMADYW